MRDQAYNLRTIINNIKLNNNKTSNILNYSKKAGARIITITSGKGGVGKTNFSVNLAIALSKAGYKVTILDADLGLANIDVVLGLVPKYTLADVIRREAELLDIIVEGPYGIKILSGGSGITDLINLSKSQILNLIDNLWVLNDISDFILIDTGAGLSNSVISFIEAANEIILIITPEPTSITDSYAVIKNMPKTDKVIKIVINRVETSKEGREIFNKLNSATKRFLNIELENLGYIYEDFAVKKSVKEQKPFIINYPNCIASKGIELIAYNIINNSTNIKNISTFERFINNLFYSL